MKESRSHTKGSEYAEEVFPIAVPYPILIRVARTGVAGRNLLGRHLDIYM